MASNEPVDSQISLWDLIYLGYSLRYLQHARPNLSVGPTGNDFGVVGHIRVILAGIERLHLERCSQKVARRLEDLLSRLEQGHTCNPEALLGDSLFELRKIITDLYLTMEEEAPGRTAFMVMPARDMHTEDLLRKPEDYFRLGFNSPLDTPMDALLDLQEGARCFAAGFSAAAIVFTFRGTEAIVRIYFEKVTGIKPDRRTTWKAMVKTLVMGNYKCPLELVQLLSELGDWRNQAMHAGIRASELWNDGASTKALDKCRDAIMRMSDDLERRLNVIVILR